MGRHEADVGPGRAMGGSTLPRTHRPSPSRIRSSNTGSPVPSRRTRSAWCRKPDAHSVRASSIRRSPILKPADGAPDVDADNGRQPVAQLVAGRAHAVHRRTQRQRGARGPAAPHGARGCRLAPFAGANPEGPGRARRRAGAWLPPHPVERQCRGGAVSPRLSPVDRPDDGPAGPHPKRSSARPALVPELFCQRLPTGLELAADINVTATLRLQGSYTVLDTKSRRYLDSRRRRRLLAVEGRRPKHWASLHALWSPGGGHEFDLMLRRVGEVSAGRCRPTPASMPATAGISAGLSSWRSSGRISSTTGTSSTHRISSPAS